MKVKYNSLWSVIYKFTTGKSNEEMTEDFFNYWIVVAVGILFLPITIPTKIIQYFLPGFKWTFILRVLLGLFIWSFVGGFGVVGYAANLMGCLGHFWIGFGGLIGFGVVIWLITVRFPVVSEKLIYYVGKIISFFGFLYFKVKICPKLEFDRLNVFIIYSLPDDPSNRDAAVARLSELDYAETVQSRHMHIIIPENDCNLNEYSLEKYCVFKGVQYGTQIHKLEKYASE